ncbi:ATP-binding protein [Micrococcaceae sp. AOP34-BR2-30]
MTSRREARAKQQQNQPAVILPLVVVTVEADGALSVTVDGTPLNPEPFAPGWVRSDFGRIMDQITEQHRSAVRVEVRESDGTSFTDIITPGTRQRRTEPPPPPDKPASQKRAAAQLVEITADGFIAGEDVGVAVIIAHTDAAHTGQARALLEAAQLAASPTGEVVLIGRVSGNYEIVRHP